MNTTCIHALENWDTDFIEARRVQTCVDLCSSVCLHSDFIFPSITEGGDIEAAMKAESSISAESTGGALVYLYFVVFNSLACILNGFLTHSR